MGFTCPRSALLLSKRSVSHVIDQHSLAVKQAITRLCCILNDYSPINVKRKKGKAIRGSTISVELSQNDFVENATCSG